MSERLKSAQLELIEANDKIGQLQANFKKQLQLIKQENHSQSLKLIEAEEKLMEQMKKTEEMTLQITHKK